jgi:hypothetical protein
MAFDLHTLSQIKIHPDGISSVVCGGIRNQSGRTGIELKQEVTSGNIWPEFQSIYSAKPTFGFGTVSVKQVLDALGTTALAIANSTNPGVVMYGKKKLSGGGRATGSNHLTYTVGKGLLVPRTLTAEHQQDAIMNLDLMAVSDADQAAPVAYGASQALPSSTVDNVRWTLGKVVLGSTSENQFTLTQKTRVELDFGLSAETVSADGHVYDEHAHINDQNGMAITISVMAADLLASAKLGFTGLEINDDYSYVILRKRAMGAGFVGDDVAEHIKLIPLFGRAYIDEFFNASGTANSVASIRIPLISDGTNAPLSMDTTSIIE